MLFNSYTFLFAFLPVFLGLWWFVAVFDKQRLPLVLLAVSAVFYALWGLEFFVLLAVMIGMNYAFGLALAAPEPTPPSETPDAAEAGCSTGAPAVCSTANRRKQLLVAALALNLLPLCYFKYAGFLVHNVNALLGTHLVFSSPGLPLGISFYTFIQIAWLVTVYRRAVRPEGLASYALFASCFPYVISGPIVRYDEVGPQLARLGNLSLANVAPALTMFVIGLAKKVLLADSLASYVNSIFGAAEKGFPLTGAEAWMGSLAYTFQLYFDFSGYTDMAIGIALFIGLKLPDNFDAPYKSTGIVDFWRRWHITLGSWLRDFLYIPLGGSRVGPFKQYRNLFLTMFLGGIWHGAGWPFFVWGAMHGAMLSVNHYFKSWVKGRVAPAVLGHPATRLASIALTFLCVNAAWVVFRAETMTGATRLYKAMFGLADDVQGIFLGSWEAMFANHYINDWQPLVLVALCALVSWGFPTTRELIYGRQGRDGTVTRSWLAWSPGTAWATGLACLMFASLILLSRKSFFLYFQF